MDVNAEVSIPTAAPGAVEEEQQQQQSEQETVSNQVQSRTSPPTPHSQSRPSNKIHPPPQHLPPLKTPGPAQDAPPRDHLTVIDEDMETSK